jgi:hypothetical protein
MRSRPSTAPRIDLTRTEVQLYTEEYNLVSRNNFAITKLDLSGPSDCPWDSSLNWLINFLIPKSIRPACTLRCTGFWPRFPR